MAGLRWSGPLRLHLSLLILILIVGIAVPLVWLGYERGTASALRAAAADMALLGERTDDRFRLVFGAATPIVSMAAMTPVLATAPPVAIGEKQSLLVNLLESSPHLDGIFVGYGDGSFVHLVNLHDSEAWRKILKAPAEAHYALRVILSGEEDGALSTWHFLNTRGATFASADTIKANYDPRTRLWFKLASSKAEVISVGPYVMATTGVLGFTLAERHRLSRNAVVGADFALTTIASFLSTEKVSPNASAYVLDATGDVVIHSDPVIMERLIARLLRGARSNPVDPAIGDPVLAGAKVAAGKAGLDGILHFSVGGRPYIGRVSDINASTLLSNNRLILAAPLSDFTAESLQLLRHGLIVSGIVLAIGAITGILVARIIARSLSRLSDEAARLGELEVQTRVPIHSMIREINSLETALHAAREAIKTFALYVPRELVRKIVSSGQFAERGAVRQDVTVLFTDIRDFTTISERYAPEDVVSGLSQYFDLMSKGVEDSGGSIVQFLGDSVYAMWNAPVADADHAAHGCRCALNLSVALYEFNRMRRWNGQPEFITRFGLHTGPAVVGSVGAENRLQYTAMGDTVNVASRLEGMNKEFDTTILVSKAVERACAGRFKFRALGAQHAKGRKESIEVFELIGRV